MYFKVVLHLHFKAATASALEGGPVDAARRDAPIIGPRTMEQFEDNLGTLDVELTSEDFDAIDQLASPGTNAADFYEASFRPNDHRF